MTAPTSSEYPTGLVRQLPSLCSTDTPVANCREGIAVCTDVNLSLSGGPVLHDHIWSLTRVS